MHQRPHPPPQGPPAPQKSFPVVPGFPPPRGPGESFFYQIKSMDRDALKEHFFCDNRGWDMARLAARLGQLQQMRDEIDHPPPQTFREPYDNAYPDAPKSRFGRLDRGSSPPIRRKRRFEEFAGHSPSPEPKKQKREMPAWLQEYMKTRAKANAGGTKPEEKEKESKPTSSIYGNEVPKPQVVEAVDGYNLKRKAPVLKKEKK
eukprot:TRINITY_DN1474_c0_g1_i2.p1 TRINITY_DN1474_c0_g1~~TRINITY_DN1474_c0_g1_i2.p1  ORF type:complete len:226 (+),score=37.90 TRINITY_DN1474_c0_g1_i2:70-678(+)